MRLPVFVCKLFGFISLASLPAVASHLVTGNGFGFAVVTPENGNVTGFYAHPYSFARPDPANPLSEGIPTANYIKQIAWPRSTGDHSPTTADYSEDSQVIRVQNSSGEGRAFMPFGLMLNALVLDWQSVAWQTARSSKSPGAIGVEWAHPIRSQHSALFSGLHIEVLHFDGVDEPLLLIPLERVSRETAHSSHDSFAHTLPCSSCALISVDRDADIEQAAAAFAAWRANLDARALAQRELTQLEQWRVQPAVHFHDEQERHLWRQSEVMLRMAQSREPNRPGRNGNGLIVACLPDGVYFTPWVRDMAYALVAFTQMGHQAEARAGLLAYFNAQPTGKMRAETSNADYQISVVRYFGDGAEEPFFTQEGATNIEFDDWGLALWALGEYMQRYDDRALLSTVTHRGTVYESARDFVVKPLLANTEAYADGRIVIADTSIWEEHQRDKKHFAFSTAMAIVGLERFANIAQRAGDQHAQADALKQVDLLQKGFNAAFIRNGKLHGTLEDGVKNDIDGALLAIINFGVVTDPTLIHDTIDRMALLKVASGGYKRVRGTYTDPAIFEYWYEQQEFLFVDFSLAEVERRQGNAAADEALHRIVAKAAADHNIIPEMYVSVPCPLFHGAIGDPTGALPMVGYGPGAFVLHLVAREQIKPVHPQT